MSNNTETLTEDERAAVHADAREGQTITPKMLRIIDAQAAALDRLESFRGDGLSAIICRGGISERAAEDIDCALYEALAGSPAAPEAYQPSGSHYQAELKVQQLTLALAAANDRIAELGDLLQDTHMALDVANARVAAAASALTEERNRAYAAETRVVELEKACTALRRMYGLVREKRDVANARVAKLEAVATDPETVYNAGAASAAARILELEATVYRERAEHEDLRLSLDAANARIAELETCHALDHYKRRIAELEAIFQARADECLTAWSARDAANARAEAAERAHAAELSDARAYFDRAESEAATLRARVAELAQQLRYRCPALVAERDAANARAEAAERRLGEFFSGVSETAALRAEVEERRKVDLQNCKLIDSLRAEVERLRLAATVKGQQP